MNFPKLFRVRQLFDSPQVDDIPQTTEQSLSALNLQAKVQEGETVAITVGSRGIANLKLVIKAAVDHCKAMGAKPFIVPAMGSHGGGTAEGQREIVEGYGITEDYVSCPIKSSMETVIVCETPEGIPVHFDKNAYEADHVIVVNRIKLHTGFTGDLQSGLMKMMLIGLGKHNGAKIYHRAIHKYSFGQIVRSVGSQVLDKCGILAGIGIIENAFDETAHVEAISKEKFEEREKELLQKSIELFPALPFKVADILLVDQIGKNISGTGMDTNIIGRKGNDNMAAPDEFPKINRLVVRGLTEMTHGNATGIGMAAFATTRAINQIDQKITAINCITGGHPTAARLPIHFETDKEIIEIAMGTIGLVEPEDAKIMWIRDTLSIAEVECSMAFYEEAKQRDDLEIIEEPREMQFDEAGDLVEAFTGTALAH